MLNISRGQIDEILKNVVWTSWPERPMGGQQTNGPIYAGVKLKHLDWGFEVSCCEHRTLTQNKVICLQLFELFLMSL